MCTHLILLFVDNNFMGSSCSCWHDQNEEEPVYVRFEIKHRDAFHLIDYHEHAYEEDLVIFKSHLNNKNIYNL